MVNPLLPTGYDLLWSTVVVVSVVLLITALVSVARAAKRLSPNDTLLWTLVAILIPVIGPTSWFLVGRRSRARSEQPSQQS